MQPAAMAAPVSPHVYRLGLLQKLALHDMVFETDESPREVQIRAMKLGLEIMRSRSPLNNPKFRLYRYLEFAHDQSDAKAGWDGRLPLHSIPLLAKLTGIPAHRMDPWSFPEDRP